MYHACEYGTKPESLNRHRSIPAASKQKDQSRFNSRTKLRSKVWPWKSPFHQLKPPSVLHVKSNLPKEHMANIRLHFKLRLVLISGLHWNTDLQLLLLCCEMESVCPSGQWSKSQEMREKKNDSEWSNWSLRKKNYGGKLTSRVLSVRKKNTIMNHKLVNEVKEE